MATTKKAAKKPARKHPKKAPKKATKKTAKKPAAKKLHLKKNQRLVTFKKTKKGKAKMACIVNTKTGDVAGKCKDVPKGKSAEAVMAK